MTHKEKVETENCRIILYVGETKLYLNSLKVLLPLPEIFYTVITKHMLKESKLPALL